VHNTFVCWKEGTDALSPTRDILARMQKKEHIKPPAVLRESLCEGLHYLEQSLLCYTHPIPDLFDQVRVRFDQQPSAEAADALRFMFDTLQHVADSITCRALPLGLHICQTLKFHAKWETLFKLQTPDALAYVAHMRLLLEMLGHLVPRISALWCDSVLYFFLTVH
jgi:hypothetical protein